MSISKKKENANTWIKLFYLMAGIFLFGIFIEAGSVAVAGPSIFVCLLGVRIQRNHIEMLDLLEDKEMKNDG